ncbi:WYL domain-containing protein [Aliiroseovarius sp. PTFE2010]|uniref:WYL domain-containing protein n=1 Tax=Aliiroseovarius sp. PTFE2010 TaxID=3417190 RepID=UPI003CEC9562
MQTQYWGRVWTCSAWCEKRSAFREFRIDRIQSCDTTGDTFRSEVGKTLQDYLRYVAGT